MVAGRLLTVNLEVNFTTTAELQLWENDPGGAEQETVEERNSQLLATWSFIVTDEPGEDMVATLNPGPDADGAVYRMRYSLSV